MRSGLLFLLLLTGSAQPALHDDQQASNQSFVKTPGGNASEQQRMEEEDIDEDYGNTQVNTVKCSFQKVLNHLNLTKNNELYSLSRPVRSFDRPTLVNLKMVLYAILDVRETDQTFIPYVWTYVSWMNDHIEWKPEDFCGIKKIMVPTELLWKPDLTIEEMIEKDKAPPSPYLTINDNGYVEIRNDQVLVSTCRMQVYKFPFDTQKCNLSFKSVVYPFEDLKLHAITNASRITEWSLKTMGKQYEWLLNNVSAESRTTTNFEYNQSMIVYTISMKRRSGLYIINFILPVLFLLFLDFASFLISDTGGEKLGFKITVLLAVTVMQLILNEILPSSSDRIPLIAVYCTGIFAMMLISLLETIVVIHLAGKEPPAQDDEADKDQCLTEDGVERQDTEKKKWTCCKCDGGETPAQVLPDKEGSSNRLTEGSCALAFPDDLREVAKTIRAIRSSSKTEENQLGYWIALTKKINKIFFICYLIAAILFLIFVFSLWNTAEDK